MVSSPWAEIASWLLLPALLWLMCTGWALMFERAGRCPLPDALLVPAGFVTTMVLAFLGHSAGLPWWLVVTVLLAVPAGALAWVRPPLARLGGGWAGVAALVVYLVYLAPVLLTGHWTWTGYNFLNDTTYQFLLTDWIRSAADMPAAGVSTGDNAIRAYLATDYPIGAHAQLATLTAALKLPVEVGYQAYLAACAAVGAMAVAFLLRGFGLRAPLAAAGGAVALCANITFQYAAQGSIKEMAITTTLLVTAALAQQLLESERRIASGVLVGIGMAAMLAAYSAAALPFLGCLALVAFVALLARTGVRDRGTWTAAGAAAAVAAILSLPAAGAIVSFARTVNGTFVEAGSAASPLGQLQEPLPLWQLSGVWLRGQYIFPTTGTATSLTKLAGILIFGLALAALADAIARRRSAVALAVVPGVLALAVVGPRVTPYVDAKMLAIAAPGVVAAAAAGLAVLGARFRWPAVALAVALAGLVGVSDFLAYSKVNLAPNARMADLQDLGKRYAGKGRIDFNEFEEFAKYFMLDARAIVPTDATSPEFIKRRLEPELFLGRTYDLDQQTLAFVEDQPYIVLRRGPASSRPPADFALDYANRSYEVWKRRAGPKVVEHMPLAGVDHAYGAAPVATATPACGDVRAFAGRMPAGSRLVAASVPERVLLDVTKDLREKPADWTPDRMFPEQLQLQTPGTAAGDVTVRGGAYEVWVRGSFGRALDVAVDGKPAGDVKGINTPSGWLRAGNVTLGAGRHTITLHRGGAGLAPGSDARSSLGPVVLAAPGAARLTTVARADASRLCGRDLDWIEGVTGDG